MLTRKDMHLGAIRPDGSQVGCLCGWCADLAYLSHWAVSDAVAAAQTRHYAQAASWWFAHPNHHAQYGTRPADMRP